jgi:hypothetical protein
MMGGGGLPRSHKAVTKKQKLALGHSYSRVIKTGVKKCNELFAVRDF